MRQRFNNFVQVALVATIALLAGCVHTPAYAKSTAAIDVGGEKQLFFDRKFIAESENVAIAMNPPKKLGPVLKPTERWEDFRFTSYFTVVQDGSLARMYYSCFSEDQWNFASADVTWRDYAFLCYAESVDGIHWSKPNLGIVEYNGSTDNNIIARSIVDGTVFIDPSAPPEKRYKMLHTVGPHDGGLRVSYSADGKHFTLSEKPVIDWGPDSQQNAIYDTRLRKYVAYLRARPKMHLESETRAVARIEMDDIEKPWEGRIKKQLVLQQDAQDPPDVDFYTNAVVQYPWAADAYFMFPAAYHHYPPQYGNDGLLDSSAAASRDGIDWARPDRRPYISLGEQDEFDSMFIMTGVGMVRYGDKIYQYYNAIDFGHGGTRAESKNKVENPRRWGWMGATEQRLDGFYSADAAYTGGWLTTPPVTFAGNRLELNINTSSTGDARVELRDAADKPIPGFMLDDCDEVMINNVRHVVMWSGKADLSKLAGQPIRLHFKMRSAKLYAFQFVK